MLVTVHRSSNCANVASGNHALAPVETIKLKSKVIMSKCKRSVMTAPQNKEPKTGSPTSQMNKTMSKNSSCSRCWEEKDRIFKALEPDGLGKSYSL